MYLKKEQLCWTCNNTCHGRCPWFTNHTPVKGWTATKHGDSYSIHKCPRYDETKKNSKFHDDQVVLELCSAVVLRAVQDCKLAYNTDKAMEEEVERFFTGDGVKHFTKLNGHMILRKLRKELEEDD